MREVPSESPSVQIEIAVSVATSKRLRSWDKTIRFSLSLLTVWGMWDQTHVVAHQWIVISDDQTKSMLFPLRPPLLFVSTSKHIWGPQNARTEHLEAGCKHWANYAVFLEYLAPFLDNCFCNGVQLQPNNEKKDYSLSCLFFCGDRKVNGSVFFRTTVSKQPAWA